MTLRICLAIAYFLFASGYTHCGREASPPWNDPVTIEKLALHKSWLKLVHYEPGSASASGWVSAIQSPGFFNSPAGREDPTQELIATLEAFQKPVGASADEHAQCRFRARYFWLRDMLQFPANTVDVFCPAYETWSLGNDLGSLSIVFATGYLGNPASYYGHTLLKLNAVSSRHNARLLDTSINFGAIVPAHEDPATYIVKGLTGGYDAGFSHIEYYFHTHNYGDVELRDLWEYELNLSREDARLIVAHTWEVMGQRYTYYFFNRNCAYRMAELLEVVEGIDVVPENDYWVLPQAFIYKVGTTQYQGRPLTRRVSYTPSRQSRLYQRYSALDEQQQKLVRSVPGDIQLLQKSNFQQLPLQTKHQILDTLIDYYQFLRTTADGSDTSINNAYQSVLRQRYLLAPGATEINAPPPPPHTSRDPSLVQFGVAHNSVLNNSVTLALRPAYYDALDGEAGHTPHAELIMAGAKLYTVESQIKIDQLDIVSIKSVSGRTTNLPGDNSHSWRLRLGADRQTLSCKSNCLVSALQADTGYSWNPTDQINVSAYLGAALQDNRNDFGNLYARTSLVGSMRISKAISALVEYEYRRHWGGDAGNDEYLTHVYGRYRLARNWDIRLRYSHHRAEEFAVVLGHYW